MQGAVQGIAPHAMRKIIEVRRVVVTPTRVVALPAELDLTNRVSREFPEAMIRVSFRDEGFGTLWPPLGLMEARIRRVLLEGFTLPLTGETSTLTLTLTLPSP